MVQARDCSLQNVGKLHSLEVTGLTKPVTISLGRFERLRPYVRRLGIRQRNIIRLLFPTIKRHGFVWTTRGVSDTYLAWGTHEDFLEKYILREGDVFVDVGAHVGRWAVRATEYFDIVVAFEPSPMTNATLRRNVELNKLSNIKVHQVALSERDGEEKLYFYSLRGHDSLLRAHPVMNQTPRRETTVATRRLDTVVETHSLQLTRESMVKVDTEGYEMKVLAGARNTLSKARPRLIVEVHGAENIVRVTSLLSEYGYPVIVNIDRGGATYVYAE